MPNYLNHLFSQNISNIGFLFFSSFFLQWCGGSLNNIRYLIWYLFQFPMIYLQINKHITILSILHYAIVNNCLILVLYFLISKSFLINQFKFYLLFHSKHQLSFLKFQQFITIIYLYFHIPSILLINFLLIMCPTLFSLKVLIISISIKIIPHLILLFVLTIDQFIYYLLIFLIIIIRFILIILSFTFHSLQP